MIDSSLLYIVAYSQVLQSKEIHSVFVCCGGGGMLAGVAAYIKALQPEVKVFGVEADDAAGMFLCSCVDFFRKGVLWWRFKPSNFTHVAMLFSHFFFAKSAWHV